jgi:hypothetical protein
MTLYIGNTHRLKVLDCAELPNVHDCTFFVRPSRTDVIEKVQIFLLPTFRPPQAIRSLPPYEIGLLGCRHFTVTALVILKAGYGWVSEDAQYTLGRAEKDILPLNWTLDFTGDGSRGKCRLKVRSERVMTRNEED